MSSAAVFVVDGDPAVRDSLQTLLALNGYEVRPYATGAAFLDALEPETPIQCVVCEADLPDTSGITVFKKLTALRSRVPFALLVSQQGERVTNTARKAGIAKVFRKPLVYRHLLEFVNVQ